MENNYEDIGHKIEKAYKNNDTRTDRSDKGIIFIGKGETMDNKEINEIRDLLIKKMKEYIRADNYERIEEITDILYKLNRDYI